MKHPTLSLLTALFLISGSHLSFAQKPVFTTAKAQKVNVFLNGAEMAQRATVNLQAGANEVVIKNVANQMDENSIRIAANKPVTILSVSFTNRFYNEYEDNPNTVLVKKVKDSIDWVSNELARLDNVLTTDKQTIQLLDKNQTVGGSQTGLSVTELSKLVDYYRQKRMEIFNGILVNEKKKTDWANALKRLQNQLTTQEGTQDKISDGKIVLQLMSEQAQTVSLDLTYITSLASWQPFYEIESKGVDQPLNFATKAQVRQTTGVNWKQVKLSFSTTQPNPNNYIPYFTPWWLRFDAPYLNATGTRNLLTSPMRNMAVGITADSEYDKKEKAYAAPQTTADYTTTVEQSLSVNYDVSIPYDILSNVKANSVALSNQTIPATYNYYAAPKLNKDALLLARITDYGQYNLLNGEANVIFEGQYVGKTTLNASTTQDTLDIALGVDKNIVINRERIKEKSGNKVLSGKREAQFVYKISVRNNKKVPVNLVLKDQYPISTDKDIEVDLTDSKGATINERLGTLTWDMKIKPGQTQEVTTGYKVKYPKDKTISNL